MRIGIRPYQFVKEDDNDKFFKVKGKHYKEEDRYYIKTKYAGVIETTKEYYESCTGDY